MDLARSYLKKRILVQDVGGFGFGTTDIRWYFEDSKPGPNTRIGPKDFFEMASNPASEEDDVLLSTACTF
jgi:hypothetical protein